MHNKKIRNPNIRLLVNDEPVLSEISVDVIEGDPELPELLRYMWAVFAVKTDGVGLAANQVGIAKRVFIINTPALKQVVINPVIKKVSKQRVMNKETCLSCPGIAVTVARHKQITLTGFDHDFNPFKMKLRNTESMVVQHEMYHLNGITLKHLQEGENV